MRRLSFSIGLLVVLLVMAALPAAAAPGDTFPDIIPLPDGWQPEGIAIGNGTTFYAGSLADGAIYSGDLRTGEGDVLVAGQAGGLTAGMFVDPRSNALFAATALNGGANVYDGASGDLLASYQMIAPFTGFINDVIVTRDAAYFTDSFAPHLYRVPLGPAGRIDPSATPEQITLTGDWDQQPGAFVFNANGIEATADGKWLIVVNSALGKIYRVDPATGNAVEIDLDGASLSNGDGLRLQGKTLYVVRNQLNQIAVVKLASNLLSGEVTGTLTSAAFDVPTTIARHGNSLYAVNARFGTPDPQPAAYDVVRVDRR
ncbi:MAG: hypothetical protein R2844_23040 [Caldilineales bacterium]